MSAGLIVDTSVWIDFLAGETVPLLEDALAIGSVVVPPVVVAELVSGARTDAERDDLVSLLEDIEVHPAAREHWVRVGELRRAMIRAGRPVSTPDAHVAQCALDRDAPLLSRDRAFPRIASVVPLRLADPG
ncbi:MAG TPA: PIN domain-containing protein [Gemmatimonadota bacterium]|nr:PIN domain-containing protein [Gemmatimonadota bacterium]